MDEEKRGTRWRDKEEGGTRREGRGGRSKEEREKIEKLQKKKKNEKVARGRIVDPAVLFCRLPPVDAKL